MNVVASTWLAILALSGCDRVFGLLPVTPSPDAELTGDASPYHVTGTLRQRYATNEGAAPSVMDLVPATATFTVTLDDGSTPTVDYASDGTFSFGTAQAGQRYLLTVQAADMDLAYEATVPTLHLGASFAARPQAERVPVTTATTLRFQLGALPAGTTAWVASTGQWSQKKTGSTTGTFDFDWRGAGALAPPIGLLDATTYHDVVYFIEAVTTPYETITGFRQAGFDQVDGGTNVIGAPLTVAPLGCVHVVAPRATAYARVLSAFPDLTLGSANWTISAIAAPDLGAVGALEIAAQVATAPPADADVMAQFVDPFAGLVHVATMAAGGVRNLTAPGATTPFAAPVGGRQFVELPAGTTCSTAITLTGSGVYGIAGDPSVAGVPISANGTPVTLSSQSELEVTWGFSGPIDVSTVSMYELKNMAGTTTASLVAHVTTAARSAHFPTPLFAAGHTYAVRIDGAVGYPGAAVGDFETIAFPLATSTAWSHGFIAMP